MTAQLYDPFVKICGIRNTETLDRIRHLPVDCVGFVFAPSKRQVTADQAAELIAYIRSEGLNRNGLFQTAGVFMDPDFDELQKLLARAPLDIVQLHSKETPDFCRKVRTAFGVKVFKSVSIPEGSGSEPNAEALAALEPYIGHVDALLLDTYDPAAGGGSGRTFSWEAIPGYREWARNNGIKLLVAGGLSPDNVAELIGTYRPDGVDVSSGVETGGVKDPDKIARFVERVKQHGTSA